MRRILHIALAATLAAICVLPASGQDYRRNKVRVEPEQLTFNKEFEVPGKKQTELFWLVKNWDSSEIGAQFIMQSLDYEWQAYHWNYYNIQFGEKTGDIILFMKVFFSDERVALNVYDVYVDWDNHRHWESSLYVSDTFSNHNKGKSKTLYLAEVEATKLFENISKSFEDFLKEGPSMELKPM